jgi:hypothetical protein
MQDPVMFLLPSLVPIEIAVHAKSLASFPLPKLSWFKTSEEFCSTKTTPGVKVA